MEVIDMPTVVRGEIVASEPDLSDVAQLIRNGFLAGYRNAGTRRNYGGSLALWGEFCAANGVHPLKVVRAHIELWARSMESRGLKPATVIARLIAVRGFYRYGFEEGLIDLDPGVHVRLPEDEGDGARTWLDRAEMGTLIRVARNHSPRSHALVSILCYNGLRISEAISIDLDDFGEERGHRVIKLLRKRAKRVLIPVTPPLWRALEGYIGDRKTGPLFLERTNQRRLPVNTAQKLIARLGARAGLDRRITPHTLRHSAITAVLDAGVDLRDAQVFAGHADTRSTNRYDHTRDNLDRNATYTLARFVSGAA